MGCYCCCCCWEHWWHSSSWWGHRWVVASLQTAANVCSHNCGASWAFCWGGRGGPPARPSRAFLSSSECCRKPYVVSQSNWERLSTNLIETFGSKSARSVEGNKWMPLTIERIECIVFKVVYGSAFESALSECGGKSELVHQAGLGSVYKKRSRPHLFERIVVHDVIAGLVKTCVQWHAITLLQQLGHCEAARDSTKGLLDTFAQKRIVEADIESEGACSLRHRHSDLTKSDQAQCLAAYPHAAIGHFPCLFGCCGSNGGRHSRRAAAAMLLLHKKLLFGG